VKKINKENRVVSIYERREAAYVTYESRFELGLDAPYERLSLITSRMDRLEHGRLVGQSGNRRRIGRLLGGVYLL
jgi:hypothetical protein